MVIQERFESNSSWIFQLSAEYFHSIESPGANTVEYSHILSPSGSVIGQQLPHHPLKTPLISAVVNDWLTAFISTSKVTLYEAGPELQGSHDSQQTTGSVVSSDTVKVLFVYPKLVCVHQEPGSKVSCIPQVSAENLNS